MILTAPAGAAAAAPLQEWVNYYGGDDGAYGMTAVSDGYVLIGGLAYSGNGSEDMYLARTDLNGNKLWTKTYGGTKWDLGYGIAAAGDGFILVGVTQSFDSAGNEDIFLVKTDANGNIVWQKNIGGPLEELGYGVTTIKDGYIITGTAETQSGDDYIYLARIDLSGKPVWQQQYPGLRDRYGGIEDCEGRCVLPVSDGYVVVGNAWAGGLFLLKTDLEGNLLWLRDYGLDAESRSVCATSDGFVIAGQGWMLGNGSDDIVLAKTDRDGNLQWKKIFGGKGYDNGYSVIPVDGGYVLAGSTEPSGKDPYDIYLIKTDLSGNLIWNATYSGAGSATGYVVQTAHDGGYIIGGKTVYGMTLLKTYPEGSKGATPSPMPARQAPSGKAPGLAWNKTYGGNGFDTIVDLVAVSDGYVGAGYFDSPDDRQEVCLLKTDKNGKLLWQKNYTSGGTYDAGIAIVPASDGFVVLDSLKLSDEGEIDLLKYDRDGNLVWNKTYQSGIGFDKPFTCIAVSDGYLVVGGTDSWDPDTKFEKYVLLIKTDLKGNEQWIKTVKAPYPQGGRSVVAVSDGYVITGDTSRSNAYFYDGMGKQEFAPFHEWDTTIVKVDLNGNLLWQKYFDSPYMEYGDSITATDDGLVISGYMGEYNDDSGSICLLKTDKSGKLLWQKAYGLRNMTSPGSMVVERDGYVIAGETNPSDLENNDVYLMKADLDGNLLWQTTYDRPGFDDVSVVIADDGHYVIGGYYNPFRVLQSNTSADAYLLVTGSGGSSSVVSGSGPDCCCICPLVLLILLAAGAAGYVYWKKGGKFDRFPGLIKPGQADEVLNKIKQMKK